MVRHVAARPAEEEWEEQQPSHHADDCLQSGRRPSCNGCRRPQRVCLCSALPDQPIQLSGRVIVLQHPHETKKKLATVPLLAHVLAPSSLLLLRGRRLRPKLFPAFDALLSEARAARAPVLVLWPGPGVQSITDVAIPQQQQQHVQQECHAPVQRCQTVVEPPQLQQQQHCPQQASSGDQPCCPAAAAYVLVAVDGTWQHAKEMFDVLQPWLLGPDRQAVQVQLPLPAASPQSNCSSTDNSSSTGSEREEGAQQLDIHLLHQQEQQDGRAQSVGTSTPAAAAAAVSRLVLQPDPNCRLRTEPHEGCTTTYEAIAQAVSHLETQIQQQHQQQQCQHPSNTNACHQQQQQHEAQAAFLAALIRPLQLMTALQAQFSPAVRARTQEGGHAVVNTKARLGMSSRRLPSAAPACS